MNRITGIVTAVIGVLVIALGLMKVIPGMTGTGILLILLGGLLFGLSFVPKPAAGDSARMSTAQTLTAIFYAPTEVFANLRRHPRWLAAVVIMTILSSIYAGLFFYRLTPERVINYGIDKSLEMPILNDEARAQIEKSRPKAIEDSKNPILRVGQTVNSFAGQTMGYAFLGLIFFVFALALGGKMNFWQAFSAAVYAAFPLAVIRFVLNSIILFVKDPTDIPPLRGQSSLIQDSPNFLIDPATNPVIFVALSAFSLLGIYWIWLNAVGIKNAGENVSATSGWTISLSIYVLLTLLGIAAAAAFPSFIN